MRISSVTFDPYYYVTTLSISCSCPLFLHFPMGNSALYFCILIYLLVNQSWRVLSRVHPLCRSVGWSDGRMVGWLVGITSLFRRLRASFALPLLPKCWYNLVYHCPYPPTRGLGSRVSGLVDMQFYTQLGRSVYRYVSPFFRNIVEMWPFSADLFFTALVVLPLPNRPVVLLGAFLFLFVQGVSKYF